MKTTLQWVPGKHGRVLEATLDLGLCMRFEISEVSPRTVRLRTGCMVQHPLGARFEYRSERLYTEEVWAMRAAELQAEGMRLIEQLKVEY